MQRAHTKRGLPKGIWWGVFGLIVLFVGGIFASFFIFRVKVERSIAGNMSAFKAGIEDLRNLDPKAANLQFSSLENPSFGSWGGVLAQFSSLFKGGFGALASFSDLANQLATLSGELASFTPGNAPVAQLAAIRDTLAAIDASSGNLPAFGEADLYASLRTQVESAKTFLDVFIPWLAAPAPHHVLILLDNPSEIRPGGGFLGSYADLTIASGTVTEVAVHDVADADAAFAPKIVPPKPLQLITTKWRPADANWFFDFPTTASKTVAFFEASGLYAKNSTTFDGAIAVSPAVVSELLGITGPITIGSPSTTFDAENFLVQIQKIVQAGQAGDATYPKQVLRDLSRALFEKLAAAPAGRENLLSMITGWIDQRDIMVWFKDPAFENFAASYSADGAVYQLPQDFNGDYLAVVDANVGGGKSDLYVSSTVAYTAVINMDGTLTTHLAVTRADHGDRSPYWWYRTPSQDYLQVFAPKGTTLVNASGGAKKTIVPKINYARSGYLTDPLVASIESTERTIPGYPSVLWHAESGKNVFTTWSTVSAGASAKLSFDFTRRLYAVPAAGTAYQFVFEKQAGTARSYHFEIDAPLGYAFAENGLATYSYSSDDPPGRLIVDLTLEPLPAAAAPSSTPYAP